MSTKLPPRITPEYVKESARRFRDNRLALDAAWSDLLTEHEGEFVASHEGEFIFGNSPWAVADDARARGWPLRVVVIDQLERQRPVVLL